MIRQVFFKKRVQTQDRNTAFSDMHWNQHIKVSNSVSKGESFLQNMYWKGPFNTCFSRVDACVQGLSLCHIIIASASCCFSSLLWPAPVRLLNRVSSPLKTWATHVPPSKTLRGTTLQLFTHSALKTRSDPLTPPFLQPVHQTQPVAPLTAGFHSFLCFYSGQQLHRTLSLV